MSDRPHHLQPCVKTARVALVYRNFGSKVSHVGLGVTAEYTAKTLLHHGIWAEAWPSENAAGIRQQLRETQADARASGDIRVTHVIISAPWIATEDLALMAKEFRSVVFVVVSHSSVGFLAADPHAIKLLRETAQLQLSTHNVFVGGNSRKFTDWATAALRVNAVCLPNLYSMAEVHPHHHRVPWTGGRLRLGMFGANRPLKNFIAGAAAAVQMAAQTRAPIELLVSSGRNEGGNFRAIQELTENIRNLHVELTGWLPWAQFRATAGTVDLVFQVSYTETFNVVAADAIAEGVPVVGSEAIDWIPTWWQASADTPMDVTRVAMQLLRDPNASHDGRVALAEYVRRGVVAWWHFLCPQLAGMVGASAAPQPAMDGA